MSSNSSLDDLNNHVLIGDCSNNIKSLVIDSDHLYRHLTEVNGRDTRGGYIEGQLEFQESLLASSFALKISLVSAGADKRVSGIAGAGVAAKRLHPNLLYLTRFDGTKRQRELEARAPMWKIDLEITDGLVYWWTESESQPIYRQQICQLKINEETKFRNVLDLKDLHLTVITPLVRTNVNGIRVRDGLSMRRPMFEDELLDDSDWEEIVRKLDKFYTGKDGKAEMDRISLQFDLHHVSDGNEELKPMCSLFSYPIINSKSRNLGILDLLPDIVSAQKACCSYGRTIYLPSKFKLPNSEREVYPRFVVQFHNDNYILDERVKQPHDIKIFASQMFIFKTPVQNEDHIREIYLSGGKIFLEAFRPKDRAASLVKHEFEFKVHNGSWRNSNIEWCSFCLENPDKIGQNMEESLKHRLQTAGIAKPGTKRRKREDGVLLGSPEHNGLEMSNGNILNDGNIQVLNEPQLFNEHFENIDSIDIDDLLRQDIPDVLQGVIGESLMSVDSMSVEADLTPSPDDQDLMRCLSPSGPPAMAMGPAPGCPRPRGPPPGCPMPPGAAPRHLEQESLQIDYDSLPPLSRQGCSSGSSVENLTPKRGQVYLMRASSSNKGSPVKNKNQFRSQDCQDTDVRASSRSLLSSQSHDVADCESAKPVTTKSLISRINSLNNRKHHDSLASSDTDSAYKSQESFSSFSSITTDSIKSPSDLSDGETELKVSELSKKFGGAKKKCIGKIKSKINKTDEEKNMPVSKQQRGDCFPAFVFMLTPLAVVVLAVILNFAWNIYGGVSDLLSEE